MKIFSERITIEKVEDIEKLVEKVKTFYYNDFNKIKIEIEIKYVLK